MRSSARRPYPKGTQLVAIKIAEIGAVECLRPLRPAHPGRPLVRATQCQRLGVDGVNLASLLKHKRDHVAVAWHRSLPVVGLGDADPGLAATRAIHCEAIVQAHHFPAANLGKQCRIKGTRTLKVVRTERDITDHAALRCVNCAKTRGRAALAHHSSFLRCWIIM